MKGSFYDLSWEKSRRPKKGVKDEGVLKDSAETPDKVLLTVKGQNGEFYTQDIYAKILEQTGREKITNGLYNKVHDELDYATFVIDEKTGEIDWGFILDC